MSLFEFANKENIEDFLLENLGTEYLLLTKPKNVYTLDYFHNGDRMSVDTKEGIIEWDPINPGEAATSKLNMKIHHWFYKGIIRPLV